MGRLTATTAALALAGAAVVAMSQGTSGASLAAAADLASPAATSVTDGHIDIAGATFIPDSGLSIVKGGTLTVTNKDPGAHTFTSDAVDADGLPLFDKTIPGTSSGLPTTVSIPIRSLGGGTYTYHCNIHPEMTGEFVIDGPSDGNIGDPPAFNAPLYQPPRLTGKRITIVLRQADVQVLPTSPATRMLTYNGTFPGPTIVRPTGADTKVTFVNKLPRAYGAVTIHEHGGHQKSMFDGQPASYLIRHGRSRTYDYPLTDGGKPLPAALRFYHDHRMGMTTRNNWLGLQGMFLTTDPREAKMGLPHGRYDVPLMITDRTFNDDHSLAPISMPGMGSGTAPNGTVGNQTLVNGRFLPYFNVQPGLYRFQILNASMFSSYNFALDDGQTFTQIGSDDGLLPHPVTRTSILLGPAQRADVVVDFSGQQGKNILLNSIPRNDGSTAPPGSQRRFLMQFRVGTTPPPAAHIPATLTTIRSLKVPKRVAMRWNFGLTTDSHGSFWSINGKRYDPKRVDHKVVLGRTERWVLHNSSDITHFVHLHEELWRTISRDKGPPPLWERGYMDTWRLDPGETVVVAAKFTDFTGDFMIHCHMLDHEDDSMMATFKVVKP